MLENVESLHQMEQLWNWNTVAVVQHKVNTQVFAASSPLAPAPDPGGGGGVLPYKGLMGTCGQPGYVFRDFCLKQGIEFIIFCLKQGIKNRNSVLNRVGKSAIFVLNRVRV